MVDRALIEDYRVANNELSRLVKRDLTGFFGSLNIGRPDAARDALLGFMPVLTDQYGRVAATIAADFYEESRLADGAVGRFRALSAPPVAVERVDAKVRYLARHLFTPTPTDMLGGLMLAADKYVKQPGRDTMVSNARRENVRFARVPTGDKTCSFCLVLASRDAVFKSEKAAGGDGNKYHGDCDCQVTRIGRRSDYPEGYLPEDYEAKYEVARNAADSGSIKDISAAMRREFPDLVNDGVTLSS